MSIVPSASTSLVPVPISDHIAAMIGGNIPIDVMQAEVDAETEAREIGRLRPLASDEDRADRELALGRLAAANKILAAYNPRLILTPKRGAA